MVHLSMGVLVGGLTNRNPNFYLVPQDQWDGQLVPNGYCMVDVGYYEATWIMEHPPHMWRDGDGDRKFFLARLCHRLIIADELCVLMVLRWS